MLQSVQFYKNLLLTSVTPKIFCSWWVQDLAPWLGVFKSYKKISSSVPFTFPAVEFQTASFNDKPWTHAREVCRVLVYENVARQVISITVTAKMYGININLEVEPTVDTTINWLRDSEKLYLYINEEGVHELLFLVNN